MKLVWIFFQSPFFTIKCKNTKVRLESRTHTFLASSNDKHKLYIYLENGMLWQFPGCCPLTSCKHTALWSFATCHSTRGRNAVRYSPFTWLASCFLAGHLPPPKERLPFIYLAQVGPFHRRLICGRVVQQFELSHLLLRPEDHWTGDKADRSPFLKPLGDRNPTDDSNAWPADDPVKVHTH